MYGLYTVYEAITKGTTNYIVRSILSIKLQSIISWTELNRGHFNDKKTYVSHNGIFLEDKVDPLKLCKCCEQIESFEYEFIGYFSAIFFLYTILRVHNGKMTSLSTISLRSTWRHLEPSSSAVMYLTWTAINP